MGCCQVTSTVSTAVSESTRMFEKMVRAREELALSRGAGMWSDIEAIFTRAQNEAAAMCGLEPADAPSMSDDDKAGLLLSGIESRLAKAIGDTLQEGIQQFKHLETIINESNSKFAWEGPQIVAAMVEFRDKGLVVMANFMASAILDIDMGYVARAVREVAAEHAAKSAEPDSKEAKD